MIWHRIDRFLARWRPHRRPLTLLLDGLTIALCWNATYLFRLGFERWWSARPDYDIAVMLGVVAVYLGVFMLARVPEGMWRFSGFGEVQRLAVSCAVAGAISAVALLMMQLYEVPRAVLALHPIVTLMGLCMTRMAYRMLYEHTRARITGGASEVRRAIVMGAGEAARLLVAGLPQQGWTVLGLLDDDPAKRGARIANAPVLGSFDDVLKPSVTAGATHIITALPNATAAQRRRAIELAAATALPVLTVPSISELQSGAARIERLLEDGVGDAFARPMLDALEEAKSRGETLDLSCLKIVVSSGVIWSQGVKEKMLEWLDATLIDGVGATEGPMALQVSRRGQTGVSAQFIPLAETRLFAEDGREIPKDSDEQGLIAAEANEYEEEVHAEHGTGREQQRHQVGGRRWACKSCEKLLCRG